MRVPSLPGALKILPQVPRHCSTVLPLSSGLLLCLRGLPMAVLVRVSLWQLSLSCPFLEPPEGLTHSPTLAERQISTLETGSHRAREGVWVAHVEVPSTEWEQVR